MSDTVVLLAPRPRRVASHPFAHRSALRSPRLLLAPTDALAGISLAEGADARPDHLSSSPVNINPISPRTSPRLVPPADALEEFLSILRPSISPPLSSPFRPRRHAASQPSFPYERPHPYRKSHSKNSSMSSVATDDSDLIVDSVSLRAIRDGAELHLEDTDTRSNVKQWLSSGVLESPVSRVHTRNPFQRHPSYELAFANLFPAQVVTHSSPSLLPLPPSPSPDITRSLSPDSMPLPLDSDTSMESTSSLQSSPA